jgi:hypothetical protein
MVSIEEELGAAKDAQTAINALSAASTPSPDIVAALRNANAIATHAMTPTFSSETPLNEARDIVVIALSDLIHALEYGPLTQEKIGNAKDTIEDWLNLLETQQPV